jgi:hypothetical protein
MESKLGAPGKCAKSAAIFVFPEFKASDFQVLDKPWPVPAMEIQKIDIFGAYGHGNYQGY